MKKDMSKKELDASLLKEELAKKSQVHAKVTKYHQRYEKSSKEYNAIRDKELRAKLDFYYTIGNHLVADIKQRIEYLYEKGEELIAEGHHYIDNNEYDKADGLITMLEVIKEELLCYMKQKNNLQ